MNRAKHIWLLCLSSAVFILFAGSASPQSDTYNPLAISKQVKPRVVDIEVSDAARQRAIPVRIYLPPQEQPAPLVLFSHGLGGSCKGNGYMGRHWASRGYGAVFVQHPGSDVSVWENKPPSARMAAMKQAANFRNTVHRVKDIPAVLDQLERWNKTANHVLQGRLDLSRVGMSGHSFGAITTQAVSGQRTAGGDARFTDTRIKAAIAFSPSVPRRGNSKQAFGGVTIPWMLMTGTKDTAPIANADVASRLGVFPALPVGGKYELVLNDAQHSAFTDRALPGDTTKRNPNHHRVILALSTAFWDAWLKGDAGAKSWLDTNGPLSVLEKEDRWQKK